VLPGLKTPTSPAERGPKPPRVDSLKHVVGTSVRLWRVALRKGEKQ
jgi:hypothetical protein